MEYQVRVSRTVADTLKTYVNIEAETPAEAERLALEYVHAHDTEFVFDSCGDTVGDDIAEVLS